MKFILSFLFISLCCQLNMNAQLMVREIDKKTGKVLLRGLLHVEDIQKETTCKWFDKGFENYNPKASTIESLKQMSSDYRFIVFMGTWCEDTRNILPKFYKVIHNARIDYNAVELYGVNRQKEALNIEHKLYNIHFVPTIIVMHQFREVGRIVESVNSSLEEDLLAIIEKDYYQLEKDKAVKFK